MRPIPPSGLPHRLARPFLALVLGLMLAGLTVVTGAVHHVSADDGCDPNEPIACIPLPPEPAPAPAPGSATGPQSGQAVGAAVAVPAPAQLCPAINCCPPMLGSQAGAPASAAVPVPPPGCCRPFGGDPFGPPIPSFCCPGPFAGSPLLASPAVPVPPPTACPPYRSIYTTINLGNAADSRALRSLSTVGLSNYWRGSALAQIQGQVADLQFRGAYATTRLYSINVQDTSLTSFSTAVVHSMEHWLYQERSLFDGSVQFSQDEWVANEYDLSLNGNAWYITFNSATLVPGP